MVNKNCQFFFFAENLILKNYFFLGGKIKKYKLNLHCGAKIDNFPVDKNNTIFFMKKKINVEKSQFSLGRKINNFLSGGNKLSILSIFLVERKLINEK